MSHLTLLLFLHRSNSSMFFGKNDIFLFIAFCF